MSKPNRRKRASSRIQTIQTKLNSSNTRDHIQNFLIEYILCEMTCKELIVGYKDAINKPVQYKEVTMDLRVIKAAVKHHGIVLSDDVMRRLFSYEKSAKKLRDSLVHNISKKVIDEVETQYGQLMAYMIAFLGAVTR